jgi:hypothetical protein
MEVRASAVLDCCVGLELLLTWAPVVFEGTP